MVVAGAAAGAALTALGGSTAAQTPTVDELNARFVVGPPEYARNLQGSRVTFRFVKDRQTGDCYLSHWGSTVFEHMVKTDDNACNGF
ncbi:MAG TPA: hypothetical protein VN700_08730 [Vicinamibacterales bacterium]|nr:hypothetical protein [Vicinamibacterales bacterium]